MSSPAHATRTPQLKAPGVLAAPYPVPSIRDHPENAQLAHGFVTVADNVRLHYVEAGHGDPVVLIPGWPQSWYAWRFCIPLLAAHGRKVYAIDPRGFGDSDMPASGYDLGTAATDLHRFIEALDLRGDDGVDIVSHDVGSWIAHAHVSDFPDDVRRLVITDATIPGVSPLPGADYPDRLQNERSWHFGFNRIEGLPEALIHGREREFLAWFFGPAKMTRQWTIDTAAFEEYLRVFSKPGAVRSGLNYYREVFSAAGREASRQRCQMRLTLPILTVGGADGDGDNLFHTMSQFSDNVRNVVFAGIGHHLPEECPEDLVDAIVEFWKD